MTNKVISEIIRSKMSADLYCKPGAVLLSSLSTLQPAPVYVMGLNPGGDPQHIATPIIDFIAPADGTSAYTHECWQPLCTEAQPCRHLAEDGSTRPEFLVRHQRNMIALAATFGATPTTLFSANAVFARSTRKSTLREQTGLNLWEWWAACWPVHQYFLAVVRPRLIVTLGYGRNSSAFGLLQAQSGGEPAQPIADEGRLGGWQFPVELDLGKNGKLTTIVAGVPHPSYFAPGPLLRSSLAKMVH